MQARKNAPYLNIDIPRELHLVRVVAHYLQTFIPSDTRVVEGGRIMGTVCLALSPGNIRY